MSNTNHIFEPGNFFGCYLLCSLNEKHKGRTYIGFTVNPNRRIQQHNAGYNKGGAKRTSGKGPWEMVLIVHGFPNEISALRFEWAWQNPEKSLRLKHLVPKTPQFNFVFKFNVLAEMLRIGPWARLGLTIRWLKQEYKKDFPINKQPPPHMPIMYGPVQILSKSKEQGRQETGLISSFDKCSVCKFNLNESNNIILYKNLNVLKCLNCQELFHSTCLASFFINDEENSLQLLPIHGTCPICDSYLLWADLVNYRLNSFKKVNSNLKELDIVTPAEEIESDDGEEFIEKHIDSHDSSDDLNE
jgi:structure-specific endonuclease subunit SLX1